MGGLGLLCRRRSFKIITARRESTLLVVVVLVRPHRTFISFRHTTHVYTVKGTRGNRSNNGGGALLLIYTEAQLCSI